MKQDEDVAGFRFAVPKGVMPYLVGAVISAGGVTGLSAYAGAKGADAQTIAQTECDKVRKDCDAKLEQVMARLDGRLDRIESNINDIKLRLSVVEQSYRLYPRGSLGAPTIGTTP